MLGICDLKNHACILKISGNLSFGVHVIVVTAFQCFSSHCFFLVVLREERCLELIKKVMKISMATKILS